MKQTNSHGRFQERRRFWKFRSAHLGTRFNGKNRYMVCCFGGEGCCSTTFNWPRKSISPIVSSNREYCYDLMCMMRNIWCGIFFVYVVPTSPSDHSAHTNCCSFVIVFIFSQHEFCEIQAGCDWLKRRNFIVLTPSRFYSIRLYFIVLTTDIFFSRWFDSFLSSVLFLSIAIRYVL